MIASLANVVGTVASPGLASYRVDYAPADQVDLSNLAGSTATFTTIGQGTSSVIDGTLASFDPSVLANNQYVIRVTAVDVNNNVTSQGVLVNLTGNLKFGQFTKTFTDLSIPVAGIPLSITRTYDTRNADRSGDFGYGWSLSVSDPQIFKAVPPNPNGDLYSDSTFKAGTRVYITNPSGVREGFTFDPYLQSAFFLGSFWHPRFDADPGVTDTLGVDDTILEKVGNEFRGFLFGFNYNPDEFTLTTKDGTAYRYSDATGLEQVTSISGAKLTFDASGITSSTGVSVRFLRDARGRIGEIDDPMGLALKYAYDAAGNMTSLTNQAGQSTTFTYLANPAHYLSTVTDPLGQQVYGVHYDARGRLVSITDASGATEADSFDPNNLTETSTDALGNPSKLTYDVNGNILSEVDPLGNRNGFTYDANNNLVTSTDPLGKVSTWSYDDRGNLTGATDPLGNSYHKTFNAMGEVLTATDPSGRVATYIYDNRGNLVNFIDASGAVTTSGYDALGRLISQTDPVGNATTLAYGDGSSPTRINNADGTSRLLAYDADGHLTRQVDEDGNAITFTYDAGGRETSQVDAQGNRTTYTYDADNQLTAIADPMGLTRRFEYDAAGNVIASIDPSGHVTRTSYDAKGEKIKVVDPLGNTSTATYDANGDLIASADPLGGVAKFGYDAAGNQVSYTDQKGHTTTRVYDANGNVLREIDPLGGVLTFTYDAEGNQLTATDELGNTTSYQYDALNRLIKTIGVAGPSLGASSFATASPLAATSATQPASTSTAPPTTIDGYNAAGLLTSETDPNGQTATISYDATGRVVAVTDPLGHTLSYTYDGVGNLLTSTDELGNVTRYIYDNVNPASVDSLGRNTVSTDNPNYRLVEQVDPLGGTVKYTYDADGNVLTATNPLGQTTRYTYDDQGNLLTTTDPRGGVTTYTYDAAGNRTSVTDPAGLKTSYAYDAAGDVIGETDATGHSITASYDAAGNETRITDKDGRTRLFTFDADDRLLREDWLSGGQAIESIHYAYDAAGNLISASDSRSSYTLTRDAQGRLTGVDNAGTAGVPHVGFTATYDPAGNLTSVSDNFGVSVASSFDANNQVSGITWRGAGIAPVHVSYTRDAAGDVTGLGRFSDAVGTHEVGRTTIGYDAAGQVTSMAHLDALDAVLANYTDKHDLNGQLTSETTGGQTTTYGYDANGELVSVRRGNAQVESFRYDADGNRVQSGEVVSGDNQVLSDGTNRYTYDAEGNVLTSTSIATGEVTKYTYDYRNRMTSAEIDDASGKVLHSARYEYDVFDNRIGVTEDGVTTRTVYVGRSAWADFDASGNVTARYLFGDSSSDILARWRPSDGTTWYLADGLGSVRDLANASGNKVDHVEYDAFGQVLSESNPAEGDRYKYAGQEYDALIGLYYDRARYYDASQGRFLSEDPLGFDGGDFNLYRYAKGSPTNFTDTSGEGLIEAPVIQVQVAIEAKPFEEPGSAVAHTGFKINDCFAYSFDTAATTRTGGNLAAEDFVKFGHTAIEIKTMASFVSMYITTGNYEQYAHEEIHINTKLKTLNAYGTISSIGFGQLGVIYKVPGFFTTLTGTDYVGSADNLKSRHRSALRKEKKQMKFRDRSKASIIDCYMIDKKDKSIRNRKEQDGIDAGGGIGNLDNVINVIAQ